MTLDEQALATTRRPDFHNHIKTHDRLTEHAVKAFLAPFLDKDPETGRTLLAEHAGVSETGIQVYHPTAWAITQRHDHPGTLSDREVLTLVLASDYQETFTQADWDLYVQQGIERSKIDKTERKLKVAVKHSNEDRADRSGRVKLLPMDYLAGTTVIPDSALRHGVKVRRSKSLRAGIARRERRQAAGRIISHKSRDWADLTPQEQRQHRDERDALLRLDSVQAAFLRSSDDPDGKDIEHLTFLHRLGRA